MRHYIILLFVITAHSAGAQMTIIRTPDTAYILEDARYLSRPHFKVSVTEYVKDNMHYPDEAEKQNIKDKVWVSFLIDTNGKAQNIRAVGSKEPSLIKEAIRLANEMPLWQPAIDSVTQRPVAKMTGFTVQFE